MLAVFEYLNGISYARWARSKRAYWAALYRLRGKRYPRERKINKKRLAIVRRKMARELPTASWFPKVPGATSYKIYGLASGPVRVKAER
jgi:hypothetical protein